MMIKQELMDSREERVMDCLWEHDKALSVQALVECMKDDKKSGKATIFKAVQTLMEKGFIQVSGLEKTYNSYGRQFSPAISKEEYAMIWMKVKGVDLKRLKHL